MLFFGKSKESKESEAKAKQQQQEDAKVLNWSAPVTSRSTLVSETSLCSVNTPVALAIEARMNERALKRDELKALKYLQDAWKKLTNKKSLDGKLPYDSEVLWQVVWKAEFNPRTMAKEADNLDNSGKDSKSAPVLTSQHRFMSRWFGKAWNRSHSGELTFDEFSAGIIFVSFGAELSVVCEQLFMAMDVDGDGNLRHSDAISYCKDLLKSEADMTEDIISQAVMEIFAELDRDGPVDAISQDEFLSYTGSHPDSLFGLWCDLLRFKAPALPNESLAASSNLPRRRPDTLDIRLLKSNSSSLVKGGHRPLVRAKSTLGRDGTPPIQETPEHNRTGSEATALDKSEAKAKGGDGNKVPALVRSNSWSVDGTPQLARRRIDV